MADVQQAAPAPTVEERMTSLFASQDEPAPEPVKEQQSAEVAAGEEPTQEAGAEQAQAEETPDQQESPADNLVDVEVDGKAFKVPPEVRESVLRHADYTRKTMALAEQRTLFESQQQLSQIQAAFQKSAEPELTSIATLDSQIAQFKQLNWAEMDTDQIVRARQALDSLKDQKSDAEQKLTAKREEFLQQFQQQKGETLKRANEYLHKVIPTWNQSEARASADAAMLVGFSRGEVENFMDPRAVQLAWKAAQWDKLQASKPGVTQKVKNVPPVTKPGSQATTNAMDVSKDKAIRDRLKKSGRWEDAADAILRRM